MSSLAALRSAACALVLLAGVALQDPGPAEPRAEGPRVEAEVRAFLERWLAAFEAREAGPVREVLAADERFRWFEDGLARYRSADEVVETLAGMPAEVGFATELDAVRVLPLGPDRAWADMLTRSRVHQDGRTLQAFEGACTMLLERTPSGSRIVSAHSSTVRLMPRPGGGRGGN